MERTIYFHFFSDAVILCECSRCIPNKNAGAENLTKLKRLRRFLQKGCSNGCRVCALRNSNHTPQRMIPAAYDNSITLHFLFLECRRIREYTRVRALPLPVFTNPDASSTAIMLLAVLTLSFDCYNQQKGKRERHKHFVPTGCSNATVDPFLKKRKRI